MAIVKRSMTPVSFNLPSGGQYNGLARVLGEGGFGQVVRFRTDDPKLLAVVGTDDVVAKVALDRRDDVRDEVLDAPIRNAALFVTAVDGVVIDGKKHGHAAVGRFYAGTLHDHQRPCSERFVARLGLQIGQAVVDAEAAGHVHRDIKTENIYLERDVAAKRTNVVLGDWGFRTAVGSKHDGLSGGTARVAAPEQFVDRPVTFTSKTDVYAIGATQFECLTGSWYRQDWYADDNVPAACHPSVLVAAADGGVATRDLRIDAQWTAKGMVDHIPRRDLWSRHLQGATERDEGRRVDAAEYLVNAQGFIHADDRDLLSDRDLRLCAATALRADYAAPDDRRAYLLPVRLQAVVALAQDDRLDQETRRKLDAVADRLLDRRREPAFEAAQHRVDRGEALAAHERRLASAERLLQSQYGSPMEMDPMGASRRETDITTWEADQDQQAQQKLASQRIGGP